MLLLYALGHKRQLLALSSFSLYRVYSTFVMLQVHQFVLGVQRTVVPLNDRGRMRHVTVGEGACQFTSARSTLLF